MSRFRVAAVEPFRGGSTTDSEKMQSDTLACQSIISSSMNGSRHKADLSLATSIDLDVEGGGRLDEDYDAGWSATSSLAWSAKGPAAHASTMGILPSAKCQLSWARAGWSDANRWLDALNLAQRSSEVRVGVLKGFLLSSIIAAIIFFFELAFFPKHLFPHSIDHDVDFEDEKVGTVGSVWWLYPLIAGSYYLASTWTMDVAQATYKIKHGTSLSMNLSQPMSADLSRKLILESHRVLLVVNYTVISLLLQQIPWIGRWLSFLFMSFIDAFYCYEQAWIARGWSLERRMRYAESRWAYMMAFGLPSTAISFFHPSGLLNLMLFMLIFPVCTVLAMLGSPQPRVAPTSGSAMTPTTTSSGISSGIGNSSALSPFLPPRLPIFWFTVKMYRLVLRFFPRLTDANLLSEPVLSADRGAASSWRPRPPPTNGYGSGFGTSVEMAGYGSAAGKRGATAAQFVGGAWNAGPRNGPGYATPPTSTYTPPPQANLNGQGSMPEWSTPPPLRNIPPPPKGAGKKKD